MRLDNRTLSVYNEQHRNASCVIILTHHAPVVNSPALVFSTKEAHSGNIKLVFDLELIAHHA